MLVKVSGLDGKGGRKFMRVYAIHRNSFPYETLTPLNSLCFQSLINLTRASALVILLRYLVEPQVIYATYNIIIAGHEYEPCLPGDFSRVLPFTLTYLTVCMLLKFT